MIQMRVFSKEYFQKFAFTFIIQLSYIILNYFKHGTTFSSGGVNNFVCWSLLDKYVFLNDE